MAYINSKTGCVATGTAGKDCEYKEVGEKQTPLIKFSLAVGKDDAGNTTWFNCQAWNPVAKRFKNIIKKGEIYLVFGAWESREHEGKTYSTLNVNFLSELKNGNGPTVAPASDLVASMSDVIISTEDADDVELPF